MTAAITTSVMARLVAEAVGTEDTDLFSIPEVPAQDGVFPVNAVFVYLSDGFLPEGHFSCGDIRSVFVEVQVRRRHNEYKAGAAKAEEVWQALQKAPLTGITNFISCKSLRSAPTYIGHNKDKHRIWTLRFEVQFLDPQ